MSVQGSCLCGGVTFTVAMPLGAVTACHCTQCRKISGHYSAAVPAPWDAVAVVGEVRWYDSSADARRGFCPVCGSYLFWRQVDAPEVFISAGTLDDSTGLHLTGHIFTADKGDYYDIADGLPQYPMWDKV